MNASLASRQLPLSNPRQRARSALLLLACWAVVCATSVPAQEVDVDALPGLIVDESDLPLDRLGQPQLDGIPGARPYQPLPAAVEQRVRELGEQRHAIGAAAQTGAASAVIAPLSGERDAPPRRDSGDRDPDRLRSAPPLPPRR